MTAPLQARILLVDDHPLFRVALSEALKQVSPTLILDQAASLKEALDHLKNHEVSLICLDLSLGDSSGFMGLNLLRHDYPSVPVVVVSASQAPGIAHRALDFGASGFIPKTVDLPVMIHAFKAILAGDIWIPAEGSVVDEDEQGEAASKIASLTPAQLRVLEGLVRGQLNKQIAYDMDITVATVKAHVTAIFKKLGVINRTQAVLLAQSLFVEQAG